MTLRLPVASLLMAGLLFPAICRAGSPDWQTTTFDPLAARVELGQLVEGLILRYAPHRYTIKDDWGETTLMFAGWDVWREDHGIGFDTKRRWRQVNHGTWKRYQLALVEPEQRLKFDLTQVEPLEGGGWRLRCELRCPVQWEARLSQWQHGVQWISVSAIGDAIPRLQLSMDVRVEADLRDLPPALQLHPQIVDAKLALDDLRIKRVSRIGGEPAQQLSRIVERELREDVLPDLNRRLAGRINRQLAKQADHLRLELPESIGDWGSIRASISRVAETADADRMLHPPAR